MRNRTDLVRELKLKYALQFKVAGVVDTVSQVRNRDMCSHKITVYLLLARNYFGSMRFGF